VANAAPIPGGPITTVCAGIDNGSGTFTLTANCGDVTGPLTVPPTITTVNGNGFTISATDIGSSQFDGGILTNATTGQTMNIQNLTISGPVTGFQLCTNAGFVLYGIFFNGAAGGSVSNVTVQHIFQFQNGAFGSCQTGRAIRADNSGTITITGTTVTDYQKSGFEARGSTIMNVSGSTAGPSHPLEGLIAQNGVSIVGAAGTVENNTIFGSGYTQTVGGPGASTAVLLFGAHDVTVTNNTLTSPVGRPGTDIGISVAAGSSTGIVISFNKVNRLGPDVPDDVGIGIDVNTFNGSSATTICNTFSNWITNIVGAEQISCTPLPNGTECQAYSAPAPAVESGKNYDETAAIINATPFTWTVDSGTLPPGLSLSSAGAITGTPTAAGTFNFVLKLVDSTGLTATQAQTITITGGGCAATVQTNVVAASGPVTTVTAGTVVHDQVFVAQAAGTPSAVPAPAGNVVFHRYATLDCTGTSTDQTVALTPGNPSTAVSDDFAAIANLSYRADYPGDANHSAATGACEPLTTTPAPTPTVQTSVIAASGPVTTVTAGTVVHDQVFVAKAAGTPSALPAPAGNVVFHRYATLDCTGTSTDQAVALTPGNPSTAVSDNFAAIANLSYRADYLGNANYPAATGACEPLTVMPVPAPALAIVKNPATQSVAVGGKAKFKITVTNAGNTTLTNVTVRDAAARNCNRTSAGLPALASMAPGTSVSYSCSRGNVSKSFTNVATATAAPPSGPSVTAKDSARVKVSPLKPPKKKPALKLVTHKKPKATG
jgi:large repetitive protein